MRFDSKRHRRIEIIIGRVVSCSWALTGNATAVVSIFVLIVLQHLSSASTPLSTPVVSTLLRSAGGVVIDITLNGSGNVLYVLYDKSTGRRLIPSGTSELVAGQSGTPGSANGIGPAASFNLPWGITSDNVNHVAYVSDSINNRIRTINLLTNNVSTLATVSSPRGIVYHASGVLYITGASIQKVVVATGAVSTIAAQSAIYWFLCVNSAGTLLSTLLYATVGNTVVRVNTNGSGAVITLVAGTTTAGFVDGNGTDAYFNTPLGIALNDEESTLFIADSNNYQIRKLMLRVET